MRMLVIVYIPDERVFGLASKIRISEKVGVGGDTWGQKPETHFCTDIFETSEALIFTARKRSLGQGTHPHPLWTDTCQIITFPQHRLQTVIMNWRQTFPHT